VSGKAHFHVRGTKAYGILTKPCFYLERTFLKGKEKLKGGYRMTSDHADHRESNNLERTTPCTTRPR
jgi:hypothetical protein